MSAEKIVQALFTELEKELDKGQGTSAAVATSVVKQLGRTLVSEMKSNQDFHDRVARIVDPSFMPSPVAIVQSAGKDALVNQLERLKDAELKKVATGRNLASAPELRGLRKPQLISLIADRAEKEAQSQRIF